MKRPRGTGSIFKPANSRFWHIQYGWPRRRESSHSDDPRVAKKLLTQRLGEMVTETFPASSIPWERRLEITVGDLIDLVIQDYKFRGLRDARTVEWRAVNLGELRNIHATKFGTKEVMTYVTRRRSQDISNATINRELAILWRGFVLGQRHDPPLVSRAPYIPKLQEDNARQGFLKPEQYEKLLAELPDRLKALFVVGYHVGSRLGELLQVRWEQVDLDASVIRLEAAQTKGKVARALPIYGDMEWWLRKQQNDAIPDCHWVFHYRGRHVGKHLDGWKEACARAGVAGLLFHDLRRTAARNLQKAGVPRNVAMAITGHRTESMYRRYAIVDEGDLATAGEKMERYFEQRKAARPKIERVK